MRRAGPESSVSSGKAWLWKSALLAGALGLGTWLWVTVLVPLKLPPDFPRPPDLQSRNQPLRKSIESADERARRRPGSAEDIGKLGMAYHANQFYEQAESAYRIASRLAPDDYRWPYCLALVKEETGLEREVPILLQKVLQLKRDYVPALQKTADNYYKQDKLNEAAKYYEMAAGAAGQDSSLQARFGLGRVAARHQDWRKVIQYMASLSREYPNVRPPQQLLLAAYEALGQADKAAAQQRNLLQPKLIVVPPVRDPLSEELVSLCCSSTRLLKEAGLLSRSGRANDAIEVARRAVEVEPGDADARHFLARTLLETRGDKPEAVNDALAQLSEGMRLRPDDPTPLWYFTSFFFEQDKTDSAVEQLRSILDRSANRDDAHYYLGLVADRQGRIQEAVAQYLAALKSNPNNAEAFHKLGLVLVTQGKLGEAIEHFQKAVHLNPMFSLARFNLGMALEQQGKTIQAIAQFEEALRLKPSDAPTHLYLSIALLKSGKIEEAAEHSREAVILTPGDARAHYGLGCALALQRKLQEAAGELREALRLRPDLTEARDLLQKIAR